jgi:uncharacterized protein (DUF2267 family)
LSTTGLDVFDTTVQETNEWLRAIQEEMGWGDRQLAYLALRGTLHALRDHLTVDEAAHLAAQLPLLVRGIYYDAWDPSRVPVRERHREQFLARVADAFERTRPVDPEQAARSVLRVLGTRISAGEIDNVRRMLPEDVRALWPEISVRQGS